MNPDSSTWLGRSLNLFGIAVVGFYFTRLVIDGVPGWVAVLGYLSLAGWLASIVTGALAPVFTLLLAIVMVSAGSIAVVSTGGVLLVPVAVGVIRVIADLRRPLWVGIALALLAAGITAVGVFVAAVETLAFVALEGGLVIATLAGVSRRQLRVAELQARTAREYQARAVALAERQGVARDVHDVLAHSLGGLVIQLDAVEALLEAGDIEDAGARIHDARALAAAGLAEARRAVGALRDGEPVGPPPEPAAAIDDLARAHRALGGEVDVLVTGDPHPLAAAESIALVRAAQESLTNARKHAPGQPVTLRLQWTATGASLEVANVVGAASHPLAATGGGHGLAGMAERFRAVPGARFSSGPAAGRFVVSASVGER